MTDVAADLKNLFADAVAEVGVDLRTAVDELAAYAAERSAHLATLVGDPGFQEAARAERDAVALKAGISAVHQADAVDARIVGVIHGAIALAARLIAVA